MADTPIKLIYLVQELGEYAVVPDGSIVNIGGVVGPNFTVAGKPLLFADGTTTNGSASSILRPDFQKVYDNTVGEAFIDFSSGKDFVLQAVNNNQFRFDADTGDITISGNLNILGQSSSVIHTTIDTDRVQIYPTSGGYTPFVIEPQGGVTPQVNVVDIKVARNGASVFTIGPTGQTYIQDLSVGKINDVDFTILTNHVNGIGIKHSANQISVDRTNMGTIPGTNVQSVLENLSDAVGKLVTHDVGNIRGYEFTQATAEAVWTITHGQNTKKVQITIWDSHDEMVWADSVQIFDQNTIVVRFNTPITGRAILMLF